MPAKDGDADGVTHLRTCPLNEHERQTRPVTGNAMDVIRMGRSPAGLASSAAATGVTPAKLHHLLRISTTRIAFCCETNDMKNAICVKMLLSPPVSDTPGDRGQQRHLGTTRR